jgi:hypothetical protein
MASIPQIARKSWAYTATADGESAARGTGYLDIHYYTPVRRGASSSCSCRLDKFVLSTDSLDQMILLLLLLLQLRLIVLSLPAVNDDGETQREREREREEEEEEEAAAAVAKKTTTCLWALPPRSSGHWSLDQPLVAVADDARRTSANQAMAGDYVLPILVRHVSQIRFVTFLDLRFSFVDRYCCCCPFRAFSRFAPHLLLLLPLLSLFLLFLSAFCFGLGFLSSRGLRRFSSVLLLQL